MARNPTLLHRLEDLRPAAEKFVREVRETRHVWILVSARGRGAVVNSNHRHDASGAPMLVELAFSSREQLERVKRNRAAWSDYQARRLDLRDYLGLLRHFTERLVLPDPTFDVAGVEVEPAVLAEALAGDHVSLSVVGGEALPVKPPHLQRHLETEATFARCFAHLAKRFPIRSVDHTRALQVFDLSVSDTGQVMVGFRLVTPEDEIEQQVGIAELSDSDLSAPNAASFFDDLAANVRLHLDDGSGRTPVECVTAPTATR
jgi:hypothetical protein